MKKIFFILGIAILLVPPDSLAVDLGQIGKTIEDMGAGKVLEAAGIDLGHIADYLDWETINISLVADMVNTTEALGKKVTVEGKVYKKGISHLRVNLKTGIEVPGKNAVKQLSDCFLLLHLLKKQAYIVFPLRKAYIKIDPDDVRDLLGNLKKNRDGKPKIEKKEDLGTETVDGIECKKVHIIMTLANGTKNDTTAWLAQNLKGFPIKIVAAFKMPRGISGTTVTAFSNIVKTDPEDELFSFPKDYVQYDNLVEVATAGKLGSHLGSTSKNLKKIKPLRDR